MDRQGNDSGTQYRSVIFTHSEEQARIAREVIEELDREDIFGKPIVTHVRPAETFYIAEDYHQEYFRKNPNQPYCSFVVSPKVGKFRQKFADKLRK
jgi:peptide-methionine (S)-S-oxide reductase